MINDITQLESVGPKLLSVSAAHLLRGRTYEQYFEDLISRPDSTRSSTVRRAHRVLFRGRVLLFKGTTIHGGTRNRVKSKLINHLRNIFRRNHFQWCSDKYNEIYENGLYNAVIGFNEYYHSNLPASEIDGLKTYINQLGSCSLDESVFSDIKNTVNKMVNNGIIVIEEVDMNNVAMI